MPPVEVVLKDEEQSECGLTAPDIATALAIAAINVGEGGAELRQAGRKAVRLRKRGEGLASYWEINP